MLKQISNLLIKKKKIQRHCCRRILLTSTKFPEYTSSSVTSRSRMMSFPLGIFLSCCCRLPPNMNPKSPKKLQRGIVKSKCKEKNKNKQTIEILFCCCDSSSTVTFPMERNVEVCYILQTKKNMVSASKFWIFVGDSRSKITGIL